MSTRSVAEGSVRLVLALDQALQHPHVAGEPVVRWAEQQRRDLRGVPLAVAVDTSVSLFDADEAPRDVEVHELVALCVQVHTFGGDIASDEHSNRRGRLLERFDDVLLLDVREAAVQHLHLLVLQLQSRT